MWNKFHYPTHKGTKYHYKISTFAEKFCKIEKRSYLCAWKDGRVVECGGLENR